MKLVDLFPAERIFIDVDVASRRALLSFLAQRAAELGLVGQKECFEALSSREELGSTGLGHGFAIPHARIAGIETSVGMLVTLAKPIDFEAADQEPVDVAVMLLMPAQSGGEQMKVLSRVAGIARQEQVVNALRRAASAEAAVNVLHKADEAL